MPHFLVLQKYCNLNVMMKKPDEMGVFSLHSSALNDN